MAAEKLKLIAVRPNDVAVAERVFGSRIPKADRLGVGVRAFELLTDTQKLEALSIGTQPITPNDARHTGMAVAMG